MQIGARQFRPGLFPTATALALIVVLTALGRWQLQRMAEKQALFAEFAIGGHTTVPLAALTVGQAKRYQHVSAAGRYDSSQQILLDNMTHEGRAGYRVLTPFVSGGASVSTNAANRSAHDGLVLLVDRGWVPAGATRSELPDIRVGEDERTISGRLDHSPGAGINLPAPTSNEWPRVLSYPKMSDLQEALGRPVFPMIVLLDADRPDGYVREWRPATFPPARHLSYAITWFALAAALLVIYVVTNLKQRPESR